MNRAWRAGVLWGDEPVIVVLGMGNRILSDDGAGIAALEWVARLPDLPPGVRIIDGGTAGPSLLLDLAGCDGLLVLDAVDAGGRPGDVVRLDLREGVQPDGRATMHDLGLATVLQDLRVLDQFPRRAILFGIQPASVSPGTTLSPQVAQGLWTLVSAAHAELEQWTQPSTERASTGHAAANARTEEAR